jgi:hypothetical protein
MCAPKDAQFRDVPSIILFEIHKRPEAEQVATARNENLPMLKVSLRCGYLLWA